MTTVVSPRDEGVLTRLTPGVRQHATATWLFVLALATLLIYTTSLGYPFFWVDPIDIGLARDRSLWQILTTSQGYLYYRPLAFFLWKLLAALQGGYQPFGFHLVHVLTHIVNVWLMFLLTKRALGQTLAAGIAALFFAWYPFSHQTVTWVVSPQPQATLFMLLSAILYFDGRTKDRRKLIWLSVITLALALPFQENAVSFGFVIAALEMLIVLQKPHPPTPSPNRSGERVKEVRWYPLFHISICLAFAALWLIIPKDPDSTIARFDQATGWYLVQGLLWPVAAAMGPWRTWFAALSNPAWAPLMITAPILLILLALAYWRGRQLPIFFFGLIWFGVMVLPIWATRGFGYVGTSPRILYVAAGGAVLIWAGLLTLDFRSARVNRWWKSAAVGLVAVILVQGVAFLYTRKTLDDQTMPAIWDVVNSGQQAGDNAKLLYINAPDQITPRLREFPVGFFRAVLMPVSVDLGQYVKLQTGVRPQTESLTVPSVAQLEDYPYNVDMRGTAADQAQLSAAIRNTDRVFVTRYDPAGQVRIVEAGGIVSHTNDQTQAVFGGRVGLNDATLADATLTLTWTCLGPVDAVDTIFLHIFADQGQLQAQADGDPIAQLFPLSECRPGEVIRDVHHLPVDASHPYTVKVGLYNRATQARLKAIDVAGNELVDDAMTIGSAK
jgi:hypothetical protein